MTKGTVQGRPAWPALTRFLRGHPLLGAWAAAHGLTSRWLGMVALAWAALGFFAFVTVPLKYPYEAAGTVVDSGVVVGLIVPIGVVGLVLTEGPQDQVRTAARPLALARAMLLGLVTVITAVGAVAASWIADLPIGTVVADGMLLTALLAVGVSVAGVALGWMLPLTCLLVFSAPGLVPWQYNALYQRDVADAFVAVVVLAQFSAFVAYARRGARERFGDRSVEE